MGENDVGAAWTLSIILSTCGCLLFGSPPQGKFRYISYPIGFYRSLTT